MNDETEEQMRIDSGLECKIPPWRKWGAYVSERAWATVREDYSDHGDAWNYLPHDHARSKAYRWGEDGLCGWCDDYQTLVFSFGLWNGKDPILKERLFGLTPNEGNHGEDVKEYYCYLDGVPTHSYMKYLYRYPMDEFPYEKLVEENKKRNCNDREFELINTGIFAKNRFFDVVVEYAKASPSDTCIRIEIFNRSDETASLSFLPQIWFRNRWSWGENLKEIPVISEGPQTEDSAALFADPKGLPPPDWLSFDYHVPPVYLVGEPPTEFLFTENDTNCEKLYGTKSRTPYVKDAFHRHVIQGESCVNPQKQGSKACFHYKDVTIASHSSKVFHFRMAAQPFSIKEVDAIVKHRKQEADAFYDTLHGKELSSEDKQIQRQALAGLLWSTQFYYYDVRKWLQGDFPQIPPAPSRRGVRNNHWEHLHCLDLIIMPDKWEYPWFASWDAAFHFVTLSLIDLPGAKHQFNLFLKHYYQHPNGQIPAYEWGFGDANPPVQAWALLRIFNAEKEKKGRGDLDFLESAFLKLMNNFSWWINRVDRFGNNVFEGGFLGLDNISIIDRSDPLAKGGYFEESDATGWMGFYALAMMRIALELAKEKPSFEKLAMGYFEHFVQISVAIEGTQVRPLDLWDEEDGFFYDVICRNDGTHERLKLRSFVGLIPFYSIDYFDEEELSKYSHFYKYFKLYMDHHPHLVGRCVTQIEEEGKRRYLFSLMSLEQMKRVLTRTWDPAEFLSPYGLRSLSKCHEDPPFIFNSRVVQYEPGESLEKIKGGNSNWRGPIWFPTNYLFLFSLERLDIALGSHFKVVIGGKQLSFGDLAHDLRERLVSLFRKDPSGVRPILREGLATGDPLWNDLIFFFEHYHGETGRGLGASHQTGWSALVAHLYQKI